MHRAARKPLPAIDPARCTGCGRCIAVCPPHVLVFETHDWKKATVLADAVACTGCAKCAVACPFDAIEMRREGVTPQRGQDTP